MSLPIAARARSIAAAARAILENVTLASDLATALSRSAGYSLPMAAWIVEATMTPLASEVALLSWARASGVDGHYAGTSLIIAGGAVPDPGVRALCAATLLGGDVLVKPAAAEPVLLAAFARMLAGSLAVTLIDPAPPHGSREESALIHRADRIVAFGHATSLAALRQQARDQAIFLGHGPRFSLAIVADANADDEIAELALDVARYDQRGCLSVQAVLVAGGEAEAARVVDRLGAALAAQADLLPAGSAGLAADVAWRLRVDSVLIFALQARRGGGGGGGGGGSAFAWHTDDSTYLVHRARGAAIELSPGRRIVTVVPVASMARADLERELPLMLGLARDHVQGLAIVGADPSSYQGLAGASLCTRAGMLQTPPLDFRPDGIDPFAHS